MFTITIFIITINIIKNNGKDKEGKPIVPLGPFKILMKILFSFPTPRLKRFLVNKRNKTFEVIFKINSKCVSLGPKICIFR